MRESVEVEIVERKLTFTLVLYPNSESYLDGEGLIQRYVITSAIEILFAMVCSCICRMSAFIDQKSAYCSALTMNIYHAVHPQN